MLSQLRRADKEAARLFPGTEPNRLDPGFGAVGLFLSRKLAPNYYEWCTPKNCWMFAGTCGDGVHFSLLEQNGKVHDDSPVVVTQPANMGQSWIVGENLYDFLSFGASRVFQAFEVIDPTWRPTAAWRKLWLPREDEQQIIDFLIDRFHLKPWADRKRFRILQESFLKELDLPNEVKEFLPQEMESFLN